jgi:hypothetical protein
MREESDTRREVYVKIAGRRDRNNICEGLIVEECDSCRVVGGTEEGTGGI